jgi:hypothetical protein
MHLISKSSQTVYFVFRVPPHLNAPLKAYLTISINLSFTHKKRNTYLQPRRPIRRLSALLVRKRPRRKIFLVLLNHCYFLYTRQH